ncbi:TPA: hypothetical protein GDO54_018509 [Pyxicephalus adspersus]|uniref:Uncharacterized protein n=1 Tax=Pyxicephalus adspersus TaxID=30357 RepID=A0AAV2ZDH8_PYXAD|nr:TPA: hypothetical protein GDO54_018509 [Pyxicephalus adspersus]
MTHFVPANLPTGKLFICFLSIYTFRHNKTILQAKKIFIIKFPKLQKIFIPPVSFVCYLSSFSALLSPSMSSAFDTSGSVECC